MENGIKVTQPISKKKSLDLKKLLFQNEFRKQGKSKQKPLLLQAYDKFIVICDGQKKPAKVIDLLFEYKFEMIRQQVEDKKTVGKLLGMRFERENTQHVIEFTSDNVDQLKKWRDFLSLRINQRCFHEQFKAHKKIGKGNFASVYLADRLEDQRSFAIKAFSKEVAYGQDKGKESIKNEIELMRELDCSSLLKLHEVYETENSLYMVLDLLEGGSMYDKIKHRPTFNHREIQIIIKSLLEGLAMMHSKRIMHRDLKPENILFRKPNQIESICIADFGLATNADQKNYLFIRCGTPGFVAPEVINCKDVDVHYEPVCDVFSLGLIFYILLTGKPAFPGKSYNDVLVKNRKCEIVFNGDSFTNIPETALNLLERMLQRDPLKRIPAKDALKHDFFVGNCKSLASSINSTHTEDDGTIDEEDGQGTLEKNLQKIREDGMKFDMGRINQLQNSPIDSPIITASSRFKGKCTSDAMDQLVMKSPLMNGKCDSIQGSPDQTQFNSPSGSPSKFSQISQVRRPSKFKENLDKVDDQDQTQVPQKSFFPNKMGTNNNPLHKYAIQQQMNKSNHEEQKQQQAVAQIKNQLKQLE